MYFTDFVHSRRVCIRLGEPRLVLSDLPAGDAALARSVVKIPLLEVQYEEMVNRPRGDDRKIVEFCGLEWDDCCLDFYKSKRHVNTPSYDSGASPMYKNRPVRWKTRAPS